MKRRQIFLNAASTVGQLVANAGMLFFLYRFLLRSVGMERLGVWSLLLATTSLVTLANQGLGMSIVKFVAKYAARESAVDVSLVLQTALISAGVILAAISLVLYPAARWALAHVLPPPRLPEALTILPFALVSLWFNVLDTVVQAGLTGHELIATCNYIEFAGSVSYLLLAFAFVPRYGLMGLACAQAAQAAMGLIAAWILLRHRVPQLPLIPVRWDRERFQEMKSYGTHFQWIAICQSLREPTTKALLTKFAGLSYTGFYDMASRVVVTIRECVVQANQTLVPTISQLHERDRAKIGPIYRESYRLVFFLAVPAMSLIAMFSPLISRLWLGRYEPVFAQFVSLLAAGWLVNILCNPAYVVDLGTGSLRWVSIGVTVTAILNFALGATAGILLGPVAVVAAGVLALITGYLIILVAYHCEHHESFGMLIPHESHMLLSVSTIAGILALFAVVPRQSPFANSLPSLLFFAALFAITMLVLIWRHPIRIRLFQWLAKGMAA